MTRVPSVILLFYLFVGTYATVKSRRSLAPSLELDRLYSLQDSIAKLQEVNEKVRCRIKELRGRWKRFVGPAQRLNDLIAPLALTDVELTTDC
ncbi:unnamed protein product [Cylicocyclus nassatus]|uniref:Uncharacterized protein n=1 Tax=Cylicocyclus nassatus TaxID=53992 RepID=A0AA36HB38_CYLNA|nr:unnamed protein product [Cylicocyclus nassatus]